MANIRTRCWMTLSKLINRENKGNGRMVEMSGSLVTHGSRYSWDGQSTVQGRCSEVSSVLPWSCCSALFRRKALGIFFHRKGLLFDFICVSEGNAMMWSPPRHSQSFSYLVFTPRGSLWAAAPSLRIVLPILFFFNRWPPFYLICLECRKYILLFLQNDKSHILLPVRHLYLELPCLEWMSSSSTISKFHNLIFVSLCLYLCSRLPSTQSYRHQSYHSLSPYLSVFISVLLGLLWMY